MTRNRVLGIIGFIWGGLILLARFAGFSSTGGTGAAAAGASMGLVFGVLLFVVGGYYMITGGKKSS